MSQLHGLTSDDLKKLKELMSLVRSGRLVPPVRTSQDASFEESMGHQAPEVYIARPITPTTDGYSAYLGYYEEETTPSDNGRVDEVVQPVLCDIFSIYKDTTYGEWKLYRVGSPKPVYNITASSLSTDDYVAVMRTKQGFWIPASGGGSSTQIVEFRILSFVRGFGLDCNAVRAVVTNIGCGTTGVSIGDLINVWDGLLCTFAIPEDLLIGVHGYAIRMLNPGADEYEVVGGIVETGICRWEVLRICCVEEI